MVQLNWDPWKPLGSHPCTLASPLQSPLQLEGDRAQAPGYSKWASIQIASGSIISGSTQWGSIEPLGSHPCTLASPLQSPLQPEGDQAQAPGYSQSASIQINIGSIIYGSLSLDPWVSSCGFLGESHSIGSKAGASSCCARPASGRHELPRSVHQYSRQSSTQSIGL